MSEFKVGDRVRMMKSVDGNKAECGATIIHDDQTNRQPFAIRFDERQYFGHSAEGRTEYGFSYWVAGSDIELLTEPATLTIEAGRYYKTRDGRKVGPMVASPTYIDRQYPFTVKHDIDNLYYGKAWRADGSFSVNKHEERDLDLIAEWVDEPAIANDNAAQSATPTAICALIENGQPKPSATPFVHSTEAAAQKEAARLARKHKGQQFGVYVLTTTSQEAAPTYEHEWQRLAAKGEKIGAIKELRRITGLGLKPTKDAVEYWLSEAA
jgi:hypothetical protein